MTHRVTERRATFSTNKQLCRGLWILVLCGVVKFSPIVRGGTDQTDSGVPVNAWGCLDVPVCKNCIIY